jgi:hypothetical protein
LFDRAGNGDPYALDADGNGVACDGDAGGGNDREDLDGPPPADEQGDQEDLDGPPPDRGQDDQDVLDGVPSVTSGGTTVVVSVIPLDDFDDLEARLDARFTALEAEFAAFEVRAENGFGRFDESANGAVADGGGSSVVVTSRQPAGTTERADDTNASTQVMHAQRARNGVTVEADRSDRQKARGADTRERHEERKAKERDRHNGKRRNRR